MSNPELTRDFFEGTRFAPNKVAKDDAKKGNKTAEKFGALARVAEIGNERRMERERKERRGLEV